MRDGTLAETSPMALLRNTRPSPIRGDSEDKREKGREFLSSFTAGLSPNHNPNKSAPPVMPILNSEPGQMINQIIK